MKNYHIAFVQNRRDVVLVRQEGYEDKQYTFDDLDRTTKSMSKSGWDDKRLEVLNAALDMLLAHGSKQ